jgi:hypothetical protein
MTEFIIVVMAISTVTGNWVVTSVQPYMAWVYDTAKSCEEAAHELQPLPGTRLICMPRDPLSLFDPGQTRPPFAAPP